MADEAQEATIPAAGEIVDGKLRIERVVGAGGVGVVLAAMHLHLNVRVAVKFLRARSLENPESVPRFLREARAAAALTSEHVVRVMDVGALDDTTPYIVMEYLEGCDLGTLLRRSAPLPIAEAVDHVLEACEAIAEAHSLGIVHRDLKPENLFLARRRDGSSIVKVLDFGISKAMDDADEARLTSPRAVLGSPAYMSPEQLRSAREVDVRSDIWSLGVILHELVCGALPFQGESTAAIIAAIAADTAPRVRARRADAPPELEASVDRCLAKEPGRRFASIEELARSLSPVATERGRASIARITKARSAPALPSTNEVERGGDATQTANTWQHEVRGRTRVRGAAIVGALVLVAAAGSFVLKSRAPAPSNESSANATTAVTAGTFAAPSTHAASAPPAESPAPVHEPTLASTAPARSKSRPLHPAISASVAPPPRASASSPPIVDTEPSAAKPPPDALHDTSLLRRR